MGVDFAPVIAGDMKLADYADQFSLENLRAATNDSIDTILDIIKAADDAQIAFIPEDPTANDPYAVAGEESIGWSLGHLVAHVTASSEEWAAYSSILARGIAYPADPRLRYETPWRDINTKAKAVQRLEESRRIRLAYLDTWPDEPFLEVERAVSPRLIERLGSVNAKTAFLFGMQHEFGHLDQLREAARQAGEAAVAAAG